jgi:TATA-binding protein-associated factor
MKGMLDLVERDVLVPHGVSFLRLDGSLEAAARSDLAEVQNMAK